MLRAATNGDRGRCRQMRFESIPAPEPFVPDDSVIYQGDALHVLMRLPSEFVQCVVTSPPYWGLRDYGIPTQIGLEPTMSQFLI